jgi:hypothetical protein
MVIRYRLLGNGQWSFEKVHVVEAYLVITPTTRWTGQPDSRKADARVHPLAPGAELAGLSRNRRIDERRP